MNNNMHQNGYNGAFPSTSNTATQPPAQPSLRAKLAKLTPATATGIGFVGLILCAILYKKGKVKPLATASKRLQSRSLADKSTAKSPEEPLEVTASTASEAVDTDENERLEAVEIAVEPLNDEEYEREELEYQDEILRQHMSELGKRSAAARARKKQEDI